jgi:hypothetical protein
MIVSFACYCRPMDGLTHKIRIEGKWLVTDLLPVAKEFESAKAALAALQQYRDSGLQEVRMREWRAGAVIRLSESGCGIWRRRSRAALSSASSTVPHHRR